MAATNPIGRDPATGLLVEFTIAAATQIWSGGAAATVFTASTPAIRCGGAS